jgi:16S rRNA processing protein RimM
VPGAPRLEVARVGRAHGLAGEVAVTLVSDRQERLAVGAELHDGDRILTVVGARPHQARWLVRFAGVDDRDAAEELRGHVLTAAALPADSGELWVHELVGRAVEDTAGRVLGRVAAVQANPASDLLVLEDERLVPLTFVVEQDAQRVVVDPPEGLLEL